MGAGLNCIIFDDLEWPAFQGHSILPSRYLKNCAF